MRTMYCMACLLLGPVPGRFPGTLPRRASLPQIDIGLPQRAGIDPIAAILRFFLGKSVGERRFPVHEARAPRPPPGPFPSIPAALRAASALLAGEIRGARPSGAAVDRGRERPTGWPG